MSKGDIKRDDKEGAIKREKIVKLGFHKLA